VVVVDLMNQLELWLEEMVVEEQVNLVEHVQEQQIQVVVVEVLEVVLEVVLVEQADQES
jgi:hypothetical protein